MNVYQYSQPAVLLIETYLSKCVIVRWIASPVKNLETGERDRRRNLFIVSITDKTIVVILTVSVITCIAESQYKAEIPRKHCKPCKGFSHQEPSECPLLRNDTFAIVGQLRPLLGNIKDDLQAEIDILKNFLGADVKNYEPYTIVDLEDIKHSSVSQHLRAKNKVEEIIHHSYGQTMLLIAYINLYEDMVKGQKDFKELPKSTTKFIREKLEKLSCKLYHFTLRLGVAKIKRKLCKYVEPKPFSNISREKDYIISVLQWGRKSFDAMIKNIESLDSDSITEKCKYECLDGKRTIRCEEHKKELRSGLRNKRKRNKNKKNRNKGKRRRNNKKCRKNNKSEKGKKRHCRNKKRNKKRSNKKRNICFKCN
ncbi:uncharacterized protein LOC123546918 [Mercenaria mercenaria]|uniref:uncharacterized protein LOC123546918 n=1 Tax=Mercenaria mercenaria TaxID=6596 RepID=UPI00234F60D8|nr:uncharacterized protein LOC123546918 [Mercenaria mercenaria]